MSNILDKDSQIIDIFSNDKNLFIFLKSGKILIIEPITGNLVNDINLKINDIFNVKIEYDFIFLNHINGKTSILY